MKEEFLNLLRSVNRDGIENLITFLEKTDFFTAPASTKFHNAFEGGLLSHSLNVYKALKELTGDKWNNDTLIIVGLFGGSAYVGCFYFVLESKDIDSHLKELSINIGTIFNDCGILTSSLVVLLLDNTLMKI